MFTFNHLNNKILFQKVNDDEIGKVFGVVAVQGDISLIIGQTIFFRYHFFENQL